MCSVEDVLLKMIRKLLFFLCLFNFNTIFGKNEKFYPEDDAIIYRPCKQYEVNCIRKFFADHSKCKIMETAVPDPFFRTKGTRYIPAFNLAFTQLGLRIRNFNGAIEEFFVNKEVENVVLKIRFKDVEVESPLDIFRFHRDGKEDAITTSNSKVLFSEFSVTTVFHGIKDLDLANSESVVEVPKVGTVGFFNPTAANHPDPIVAKNFALFTANFYTVLQEGFLAEAAFFAGTFLQYTICDFGLKIF